MKTRNRGILVGKKLTTVSNKNMEKVQLQYHGKSRNCNFCVHNFLQVFVKFVSK